MTPKREAIIRKVALAAKQSLSIGPKKRHGNIKCGCGHTQKDHHNEEGWCHSGTHPKAGQCGCTWFYPNDKYFLKQQKKLK